MIKTFMLVSLLTFCGIRAAYSELSVYTTARELMEWCQPYVMSIAINNDLYAVKPNNLCTGFVTGITDAHQRFVYNGNMPPYWCGPGGVSRNQLATIVTRYMQNIDNLEIDAAAVVIDAVKAAYPCNGPAGTSR